MRSALYTITLALMMVGVAVGQSYSIQSPAGAEKDIFTTMFAPGVSMTGVQNNPGIYDQNNNKCWGNMFVVRGRGEWFTVQLTITMDYVEGLPNPKEGNLVTYGNWTMTVYKEDRYFGTYFGDLYKEGSINWWVSPKTGAIVRRNTVAVLRTTGSLNGDRMDPNMFPLIRFNADTRLDGNVAFTNAVIDLDF